jgi:hypothetical protein
MKVTNSKDELEESVWNFLKVGFFVPGWWNLTFCLLSCLCLALKTTHRGKVYDRIRTPIF